MFYISRVAAESEEVKDSITEKVERLPEGDEKEFLNLILPAIENALSHYSGMAGVTIAGELDSKEARITFTMYANEIGE